MNTLSLRRSLLASLLSGLLLSSADLRAANSAITVVGGTNSNLTSITVGGATYTQSQLVGSTITAFTSSPGGNNSNILLEDGGAVPASGSRQALLGGDFNLNTGVLNAGNGNATVSISFASPVVNVAGPDIFLFEIASNFDPDPFGITINGQTGSIDGGASGNAADLGDWGDTGLVSNSDLFARAGGAPTSLSDLENGTYNLSFANIAQRLYGVGLDLTDYGVAPGGTITGMQYGSAAGGQGTADPVLLVGVPEPGTTVLALLGGLGTLILRRRQAARS